MGLTPLAYVSAPTMTRPKAWCPAASPRGEAWLPAELLREVVDMPWRHRPAAHGPGRDC